jgi:hypothetical protein
MNPEARKDIRPAALFWIRGMPGIVPDYKRLGQVE